MNNSRLPKIIVVCGPTGVGKTTFAIDLAVQFAGEIVGADSMQIYRQMSVGTAKPTPAERNAVPHHLVDIVDPDQSYDAAVYAASARQVIGGLVRRQVLPLVVGGTGLYIKALVYGLFRSQGSDHDTRERLRARLEREGAPALHATLAQKDPRAAARIHPNDSYRLLRALEVVETTGRSISDFHRHHAFVRPRYTPLTIGLSLPRPQLYAQIDQRVDRMVQAGLLEEVRNLLARGYDPTLKSMQALGYRHMVAYLQSRLSWDEAVRTLKRDHRRYAKRQLTWFSAVPGIVWLAPDQTAAAAELVAEFLGAEG